MVQLLELKYSELVRKNANIGSLQPKYFDRAREVARRGGTRLQPDIVPDRWHFTISSGTTAGKQYDAYVNWSNLEDIVRDKARNRKRVWNKDKTKIDFRKLAGEVLRDANIQLYCSCLTGDTKIRLLDGKVLSLEEIHKEYGSNKEFWVYSSDEAGNFIPAKAICLGITGQTSSLLEVELDNGEKVRCTPEHMFRTRQLDYVMAKDLVVGQSLLPLYTMETKSNSRYSQEVVAVRSITVESPVPVYDLSVAGIQNYALSAGVFVHNCPADLYWGGHYIRTKGDSKYTEPELRSPDIRNPHKRGAYCKHLHVLMDNLPFYISTMSAFLKKYYSGMVEKIEKEVLAEYEKIKQQAELLKKKLPPDEDKQYRRGSV